MDFFRAQHDARRRTRLLTVLFALSLLSLLAMTNFLLYLIFSFSSSGSISSPASQSTAPGISFYIMISIAVLMIVLISSLFKALSLRQGGDAVAQMLNARLLAVPNSPAEQRLLNVVEEMAIASGTPVPPVYIMEESAINAFAAGHSNNDAVIGITRGAMEKLTRDELQGVIAHEFSHILHGDMRLNLRLIGLLHGIMVLGVMGHYILRASTMSRRDNRNNAPVLFLGLGLLILGSSGTFFGNLIKAAVSRQREYLADASAVQYTRNRDGIAGALKRIAADSSSPVLTDPGTAQISHALFSEGVHFRFSRLFATHPPLADRIRALDPTWDGKFDALPRGGISSASDTSGAADRRQTVQQGLSASLAISMAIARAGMPDDADIREAREIHASLPDSCIEAAHNPLGAAAVICALLMQDELQKELRSAAAEYDLNESFARRLPVSVSERLSVVLSGALNDLLAIEPAQRLPLVNICLASLRQMSKSQYLSYRQVLVFIVRSDQNPDLGSWLLYQLVSSHLDRNHGLTARGQTKTKLALNQLGNELETFLSVLAHSGNEQHDDALTAFTSATQVLQTQSKVSGLTFKEAASLELSHFQAAASRLLNLEMDEKKILLEAIADCVLHDQHLTVAENEIMRVTAEMLGCPLPAKIQTE